MNMKKCVTLLGILAAGFCVSACVQEIGQPYHVTKPFFDSVHSAPLIHQPESESAPAPVEPAHHSRFNRHSRESGNPENTARTMDSRFRGNDGELSKISPNAPASLSILLTQPFNKIIISSPSFVTVHDRQPDNQIIVNGTQKTLKDFSAKIQNGILTIHSPDPVGISLNLVNANNMKFDLKGGSVTRMRGDLVLSRIHISGNAKLNAYWLDTSNLHIVARDNAKLFLGGVITNLDIVATGNAEIDAKYLRVTNAYVRTTDEADVGISVSRSLSTLSTGHSTVYYYTDSPLGLHYLDAHGSALRMKGIPPDIHQYQHPDQYDQ